MDRSVCTKKKGEGKRERGEERKEGKERRENDGV